MKEYIERKAAIDDLTAKKENATSLCKNETNPQGKCIAWGMASGFTYAIGSIEGIPSADVVEVVRCKDCKYCIPAIADGAEYELCIVDNDVFPVSVQKQHFCSRGAKADKEDKEK